MRRSTPLRWAALPLACALSSACAREPLVTAEGPTADRAEPGASSTPKPTPRASSAQRAHGCTPAELEGPAGRLIEGRASYYHDSLAGNRTASGQRYRPDQLTAAHRKLPFGTRLRIRRADAPDAPLVCVTVNDRGPFAGPGRVVDLSRRAAEHLGMLRAGVVPVRAEVVGRVPLER